MNLGTLFFDLGITGSEKTIGQISGARQGLRDTASAGLAAKAAILGVFYAIGQLVSASGKVGTDLTNTSVVLGMNVKELQQYRYAAQQVGVSNQTMDATFKTLQATMTKTLMGEGAPEGLARFAQIAGVKTREDIERFAKEPQLLLQKLQEYALKEPDLVMRNRVLKSFGMDDQMTAALSRQAFRPEVLRQAPTYGDGEVKALDHVNAQWSNLGTKIEMAMGHLNAANGGKLVADLSMVTDKVLEMVNAFAKLSDKIGLLEKVGNVFKGWGYIFTGIAKVVDRISELSTSKEKRIQNRKEGIRELSEFFSQIPSLFGEMIDAAKGGAASYKDEFLDNDPKQPKDKADAAEKPGLADRFSTTLDQVKGGIADLAGKLPDPDSLRLNSEDFGTGVLGGSFGGMDDYEIKSLKYKAGIEAVGRVFKNLNENEQLKIPKLFRVEADKQEQAAIPPPQTTTPRAQTASVTPRSVSSPGAVGNKLRLVPAPSPTLPAVKSAAIPRQTASTSSKTMNQDINIQQTLNFSHEGKDPQRTADSTRQGLQSAFRQMSAQSQVT